MNSLPLLTLMMVVPLVGAVVVAALPSGSARLARPIALGASLVTLVLAVLAWVAFDNGSGEMFQLTETHSWIPQFGVSYALGVDGIALALIVMAAILTPVCVLAAWNDVDEAEAGRMQRYFALMLVLEAFMVGVFAATDVFLFYVFFEAMLIPVYFLIGLYGGPQRQYAAMKFLLFSLAGGLVMLVSVIAVYFVGPGGDQGFLVQNLIGNLDGSQSALRWMFVGFFIAFAVKAPMWPVHTWLPDAATEARPATAVLLVGVLDKVGTYGMIRFCLQLFPEASQWATPVVHHPRGGLGHLRRAARHRPDRHDAAHRVHLDQPLRLHRARDLRADQRRRGRVDPLHGQPRLLDRRAVPHRRASS